ncbi:MAG TPA: periplasmic heavy metal sensor [Burkholderiales bacterium]|nr:periplasmic heavy metal sensor [Burkholderiales bacterium]
MKGSLKRTAIAALLGGAIAAPAFAQDRAPQDRAPEGGGPGMHHRWHRNDPQARADRMEFMVQRMFSSVKASDEQKNQAGAIVRKAASDIRPLEQKLRDGRRAGLDLLSRPTIDRNAIEAQRAQQAALREQISQRTTQAMADLAEVLTPDQRAALAKRMSERFGGRRAG